LFSSSRNEAPKSWDVFVVNPPVEEDETLTTKWIEVILKILKITAYLLAFVVVLSCAVISKGVVLFMTSLIKPNRTGITVCNQGVPGLDRDKRYEAVIYYNDPERVAWIWILIFCLIIPEIMTLFRSARICTFKSFKKPTKFVFSMVNVINLLFRTNLKLQFNFSFFLPIGFNCRIFSHNWLSDTCVCDITIS